MKLSPRLLIALVLLLSFILNNIWAGGGPDSLYFVSRLLFDLVFLIGGGMVVIMPSSIKQWVGNDVKQRALLRFFGLVLLLIGFQNLWLLFRVPKIP